MGLYPDDVFSKFHDEHISFTYASSYLLTAQREARTSTSSLGTEFREFEERVVPTYLDPHQYFMARLFVSHIASFELFLQELVACVVSKNPMKVGGIQFRLSDILETDDPEQLIQRAIDELLNKLMYKKPIEYLREFCELLSIDSSLLADAWPRFVEAKARRDLGVHNGWVCNPIYLRKLSEAGVQTSASPGDRLLPTDHAYAHGVNGVLYEIAKLLKTEVLRKHWKV